MASTARPRESGIWSPKYRFYSIGLTITILMAAFETYAVMAVAPTIAADLQGLEFYSWIFNSAMLPQIIGTVVFARLVDRYGPTRSLVIGAALLIIGLVGASLATNMYLFVLARIFQGFGMGALINVVYASIALVLPDGLRPRAFALISAAYVLPAVLGPFLTGFLADAFTWRAVFYAVIPLIILSTALVIPSLRGHKGNDEETGSSATRPLLAVALAVGVALISFGFSTLTSPLGMLAAASGVALTGWSTWKVLPKGVLGAKPVMPAALATRGLCTALFLGAETNIVFVLTVMYGLPVAAVGLAVSVSALTWALSSWWQARADAKDGGKERRKRLLIGVIILFVAETLVLALPWSGRPEFALMVAVVVSLGAGLGMGVAEPLSGTIALSATSTQRSGSTASGMQLVDLIFPSIAVAGASALASGTIIQSEQAGPTAAFGFLLVFALLAVLAAKRLYRSPLQPAATHL